MSQLNKPHFQDAEKARVYLEALRWPNGPVCPHCGVVGGHYTLTGKSTRPGLWKCKDCREQFTVTVGTVFERSKIALHIWLQAVYLLCSAKKRISSHQLHRTLGVTYKTAWFMTHRIREAMTDDAAGLLGGGGGTVEVDETYWGNVKGKSVRAGSGHKMKIVSLVERHGKARSFHVKNVKSSTLQAYMEGSISPSAKLMTDEAGRYTPIGRAFASHEVVNHSKGEYVRGNAHTNTVEGFFSILKRGLVGTFHHVGEQHLHRYVSEFDFRYSLRAKLGVTDSERTDYALKGIGGKRLTYRRTSLQLA